MKMLIFAIIIFLLIKLFFFVLLIKKNSWQYGKIFAIANLSALTASILIWIFISWLCSVTDLILSASGWNILAAFVTLIIVESIIYCKFEKDREKSEMIVLVIVINLIAIILSSPFLIPSLAGHRPDKAMLRISCTSNLKQIGLSLKQYAMDYDDYFPDKSGPLGFEKLRSTGYLTDYKVYRCPSCEGSRGEGNQKLNNKIVSYVYKSGLRDNDGSDQSKTPLAWDRPTNHEDYGNVLFLDGHVKGFEGKDWMEQAGIKKSEKQVDKTIANEMQKASRSFKNKDYSTAESHFKTVVNLKPDFAECWSGLGMCLAKQEKNDEAKRAFEKALSIHQKRYKQSPNNYNELWQQVIVLIFLNRKSEADKILKIGIKKFPNRPEFKEPIKKLIDVRTFLNKNGEA